MRIEKGHVTGAELNGLTTPADIGLGRMLKKSGDFVGRALGERPALREPTRLQLVGITPVDASQRLRGGAHLVGPSGSSPSQGYVTSICMSDCMSTGRPAWIGLALLAGGHGRHGEQVVAASPVYGDSVVVTVGSPHRVDPENARVRA
jgi:sarcosine oxidase subunit alpha